MPQIALGGDSKADRESSFPILIGFIDNLVDNIIDYLSTILSIIIDYFVDNIN
jgi:hypothetical protein